MSARAGQLLRIGGLDGLALAALFLVAATSGFVFREPALHDVLLAGTMCAFLAAGLAIPRALAPLALLLAVYVIASFIASSRTSDVGETMIHSAVTLYLAASTVFFACVAAFEPERTVKVILSGLVVAAAVAALAGICGYFDLLAGSGELFQLYGRARGTFKDPNVFGPFLVPPLLYIASRIMEGRASALTLWGPLGIILMTGLLLSFSRGAWLNFAIAAAVFTLLATTAMHDRRLSRRAGLVALAGAVALALCVAWAASSQKVASLMAERAQITQNYDTGATGRFAGQAVALGVIVAEPLGIGYAAFERYHPEQPHNVYLNTFLNAGWLGGFSYLTLVLVTIVRSITLALRRGAAQPIAIVLCASFAGLMVEGLIVDTDHWRHFMVIVGLIWGMGAGAAGPAPRPGGTGARA